MLLEHFPDRAHFGHDALELRELFVMKMIMYLIGVLLLVGRQLCPRSFGL